MISREVTTPPACSTTNKSKISSDIPVRAIESCETNVADCMLCASAAAKTSNFRYNGDTDGHSRPPSEAAAFAATSTLSSSSSAAAAAADSIISNAPFEQINLDEELQTKLFNYPSYTKRAQHPAPGGLVQLCQHKGCFNAVDFERDGGLCCIHQNQTGPTDGGQWSSDDASENDGKIRGVTGYDGLDDRHSTSHGSDYCLDEVGKKRGRPMRDSISGKDDMKRQRVDAVAFDLTDVPSKSPIPKSAGYIKDGAAKYRGVCFNKQMNKWQAQIYIDGKDQRIGYYENEEEAAVDYARAVFKYKGQGALDKAREQGARDTSRVDAFTFDLTDVPPQSPVPKCAGYIKEGASKYTGVTFNKPSNNWQARIAIDGKLRFIGYYENEEDAGSDYARAVFKYKGQGALDKAREQRARDTSRVDAFTFDLTNVPPQSPVPKCGGYIKEGASKYRGVCFDKQTNKWHAKIYIDGKERHIGRYENEEEAAVDYKSKTTSQ
eukprot:scaffold7875_cov71-Skeletonema_dohrnii-CCMP3373.AAC.1